ncbi:unnamed protein product, partial [Amoebophrya sp. A25]
IKSDPLLLEESGLLLINKDLLEGLGDEADVDPELEERLRFLQQQKEDWKYIQQQVEESLQQLTARRKELSQARPVPEQGSFLSRSRKIVEFWDIQKEIGRLSSFKERLERELKKTSEELDRARQKQHEERGT